MDITLEKHQLAGRKTQWPFDRLEPTDRRADETEALSNYELVFILTVLFLSTSALLPTLLDGTTDSAIATDDPIPLWRVWVII